MAPLETQQGNNSIRIFTLGFPIWVPFRTRQGKIEKNSFYNVGVSILGAALGKTQKHIYQRWQRLVVIEKNNYCNLLLCKLLLSKFFWHRPFCFNIPKKLYFFFIYFIEFNTLAGQVSGTRWYCTDYVTAKIKYSSGLQLF